MPLPAPAPIVASRLLLRAVDTADLADLLRVNGDDATTRHLPYASWQSLEDGQAWLARMLTLQAPGTTQQRVIERRDDGRVIGTLLLFKYDEASTRLEIGYVIGRAHWRQGYVREAVTAACNHAFDSLGVRRIEAEVQPDNLASNALLQGLGFVQEGRLRQRWVAKGAAYDTFVYGCLAHEWAHHARPSGPADPAAARTAPA